ncbi:MAG: hypothetical protein ACREBE_21955 [bacterium]
MKRPLLLAGVAVLMAACSDSTTMPTTPAKAAPAGRASFDFSCRSGYVVAYDEDGNPYCVPDPNGFAGGGDGGQGGQSGQGGQVGQNRPTGRP